MYKQYYCLHVRLSAVIWSHSILRDRYTFALKELSERSRFCQCSSKCIDSTEEDTKINFITCLYTKCARLFCIINFMYTYRAGPRRAFYYYTLGPPRKNKVEITHNLSLFQFNNPHVIIMSKSNQNG